MGEEVQVLGAWMSPFSLRVDLALKLKSIEYQYIEQDLKNKSNLLLNYNPIHKKVPVLVHNGNTICESLIVLEYIDENWKNSPMLPLDLHERAKARFWAKYIDDKVIPSVLRAARSKGEERAKAVEEAGKTLEALENELENRRFFGGEEIGFVDIVGMVVAYWFPAIEEGFEFELLKSNKFPNLSQWSEELVNHSLVKEILPPKPKLVAYLQAVLSRNT